MTGAGLRDDVASGSMDLEAMYQQAPCGYLLTSDDGTITHVNDTFLTWTGHARAALLGTPLPRLLPVGDRILYTTHCVRQLRMVGAVAEMLIEVVGADGARRAALLSASRSAATADGPAVTRVIVLSAAERRRYEQELVAALHRAEESEARRVSAEAHLAHQALHDALTGMPNRAGLTARLQEALDSSATTGAGVGVLFVDLDHFKAVNDSLGHAAGDELLTVVAGRLRSAVREDATVARLSGDEFVVLDTLAEADQVAALAQRLLDTLAAPVVLEGLEVVTSASVGAAVAATGDTPEGLLRRADIARYRAKARGRGCWELHQPDRVDPVRDRLRVLGELRHGIERGELRLLYQPRIDLRTGRLDGVEALVRWEHPTRGLLPPTEFVDVAEESGLIRALGAWVLEEAVRQTVRWRATVSSGTPVQMAVNLSTRQLTDPDLVVTVTGVLARHGLSASQLTLEITETALMSDPELALRTLTALHELGVGLAVDDFGTGYASLTYLQRFPITELKIDRSFVSNLSAATDDAAIVASCIQLAHAVGARAVGEGVETDAQHAALLELGCDLAQGYRYARPLTPNALTEWLMGR